MKKALIFLMIALLTASCVEQRFESPYALGVTMTKLAVGKAGGTKHIVVYSNTAWQASLDEAKDWCELQTPSGKGLGEVQIFFSRNRGFERTVTLILTSGDEKREILITQSAGVTDPYMEFADAALTVNNLSGRDSVWINSNIGDEIPESGKITVTYGTAGEEWVNLEPVVGSTAVDSSYLAFSFLPNNTGADRTATVTINVAVASGNDLATTFELTQFAQPTIKFSETPVLVFAEQVDVPFAANFAKYTDEEHQIVYEGETYDAPYSDWIKDAKVEGNVLKLSFNPLSIVSDVTRSAKINLSYTDASGKKYDFVYNLVQSPIEMDNLSSEGTSNCYIVSEAGYKKFNAAVRGNGVIPAGSSYETAAIEGGVSASVLWETVNTAVAPEPGSVISNVVYSDGIICFNCAGIDGNACIALRNAAGDILWSWHIWAAMGYKPAEHECVFTSNATYFKPSDVVWMDRNIGALSDGSDKNTRYLSVGFYFQHSRKDPMVGSADYVSDHAKANTSTNFMKTTNNEVWSSSADSYTEKELAAFPTLFTTATGVFSDQAFNSCLWGASKVAPSTKGTQALDITVVKTLHDPCPVGYQVPAAWHYYSISGGKIEDCFEDGFQVVENDVVKMWLPAGGYRSESSMSFNKSKAGSGFYFTAISSKGTSARQINYFGTTSSVYNLTYSNAGPNTGRSVRCVKENQKAELL